MYICMHAYIHINTYTPLLIVVSSNDFYKDPSPPKVGFQFRVESWAGPE